jgi:hypothetical protein
MKHQWKGYRQYIVCAVCGFIRRADGSNDDKECRGPVKLVLRKSY